MLLFKFKKRTPGSRWRVKLKTLNIQLKVAKSFFFSCFSKSGHSNSGKITVRHKKNVATNTKISLNILNLKLKHNIGLIVSFLVTARSLKLFNLIKYSDGTYAFLPSTSNVALGSFFFSFNYFIYNLYKKEALIIFFFRQLQKFFVVSSLVVGFSLKPSVATASGCYAQVLNFLSESKTIIFQLPSGSFKTYENVGCCFLGRAGNEQKKKVTVGKAGISYNQGIRPTVRGNAMNPVDHPQGGRTKSKQPEKSPWG